MGKSPNVAAILGILFSFFAYIYVWNLGRFFIVMTAYFGISYLFGIIELPILSIGASFVFSILVSYDCWRLVKLENKAPTSDKEVIVNATSDKEVIVKKKEDTIIKIKDIFCPKCRVGLALPYTKCPNCGSATGIIMSPQVSQTR